MKSLKMYTKSFNHSWLKPLMCLLIPFTVGSRNTRNMAMMLL